MTSLGVSCNEYRKLRRTYDYDGPGELYGQGNPVRATVIHILGAFGASHQLQVKQAVDLHLP